MRRHAPNYKGKNQAIKREIREMKGWLVGWLVGWVVERGERVVEKKQKKKRKKMVGSLDRWKRKKVG